MKDMFVSFAVPGVPQGKERPRHTKDGHVYTPKKTVEYQGLIAGKYWQALNKSRQTLTVEAKAADIRIIIEAVFAVPKSDSKQTRADKLAGKVKPRVKPDADNIAKAVLDALNGFAYYDDAQVTRLEVNKVYGETPGIVCHIIHNTGREDDGKL